jgi:hypothetical protein
MSVRVVVEQAAVEQRYEGGVARYESDAQSAVHAVEGHLVIDFEHVEDANAWAEKVQAHGVEAVVERAPFQRFDFLSRSASGLSYVRERKLGVTRVLTPSELDDFNDPPPCPDCGEQFGCEHFNCAGEPLLSDGEIETAVPREWSEFAKDYGVSHADLDRLRLIERNEGEYRLADGATSDMRTLELVLLLNEAR